MKTMHKKDCNLLTKKKGLTKAIRLSEVLHNILKCQAYGH
jgi:hypothetical protein